MQFESSLCTLAELFSDNIRSRPVSVPSWKNDFVRPAVFCNSHPRDDPHRRVTDRRTERHDRSLREIAPAYYSNCVARAGAREYLFERALHSRGCETAEEEGERGGENVRAGRRAKRTTLFLHLESIMQRARQTRKNFLRLRLRNARALAFSLPAPRALEYKLLTAPPCVADTVTSATEVWTSYVPTL